MSWQTTAWVAKYSRATGNTRLVFMMLANHMGGQGDNAYPSIDTLAIEAGGRDTPLSRNTVIAAIKRLEELGEIVVYEKAGRSTGGRPSNRYELPLVEGWEPPHGLTPRTPFSAEVALFDEGGLSRDELGDFRAIEGGLSRALDRARVVHLEESKQQSAGSAPGCNELHPRDQGQGQERAREPAREHAITQAPPAAGEIDVAGAFEVFWAAYPKRPSGAKAGDKKPSRDAWAKLRPEERAAARDGLAAYVAAKGKYVRDAQRYLRDKLWDGVEVGPSGDEPTDWVGER